MFLSNIRRFYTFRCKIELFSSQKRLELRLWQLLTTKGVSRLGNGKTFSCYNANLLTSSVTLKAHEIGKNTVTSPFLVMFLYCCCENTLHSRESCSSPKILAHSRMRPLLLCHSPNFHFYAQENVVRLKRIQIEESVILWMLSFFFLRLSRIIFASCSGKGLCLICIDLGDSAGCLISRWL